MSSSAAVRNEQKTGCRSAEARCARAGDVLAWGRTARSRSRPAPPSCVRLPKPTGGTPRRCQRRPLRGRHRPPARTRARPPRSNPAGGRGSRTPCRPDANAGKRRCPTSSPRAGTPSSACHTARSRHPRASSLNGTCGRCRRRGARTQAAAHRAKAPRRANGRARKDTSRRRPARRRRCARPRTACRRGRAARCQRDAFRPAPSQRDRSARCGATPGSRASSPNPSRISCFPRRARKDRPRGCRPAKTPASSRAPPRA